MNHHLFSVDVGHEPLWDLAEQDHFPSIGQKELHNKSAISWGPIREADPSILRSWECRVAQMRSFPPL